MLLYESKIRTLPRIGQGKVRDIYAVGTDKTLIVTSDRLSAFDVVLSDPIPDKGRVLNEMANFWFERLRHIVPNQLTGVDEVAERTVRVLKRTVPAAQPGIVFLSGGQSDEAATAHLNAMAAMKGLPWPLTFSYSRALQNRALNTWRGQAGNVGAAQKAFLHRAHMNGLAAQGKWRAELEKQAA